ncbi:phosphate-starvation-inducible PsiE family protein [Desulfoferrobacter suflitae]|uniref:phosphate-starvation-inducible PsiE family protein n=1 Tax=Desulfoferrobacter suflitae TaxID=2865782 RepID=UPI002164BD2E|nr:phosphate-starvation-inducible PsiE family protein [Desulfoferrobacter suflitae]MCK8600367.1 phosphate-starvation-inducible PsiE family protein [Desulfoferrobacter suflitae]
MAPEKSVPKISEESLSSHTDDPFINFLHAIIRLAVRVLAVLMIFVIIWGIWDVIYVLYNQLGEPPFLLLNISDILNTFGAFMAVLIAIEIFMNISLYLRKDVIHVKLVVATALMAVARKVIIFDFNKLDARYVWATAAVVLALGITYYLLIKEGETVVCQPENLSPLRHNEQVAAQDSQSNRVA